MLDVSKFCERMRRARKNAGMTTTDAAFALHTDQAMVSRYETGVIMPRIDRVADMADLYGCSIDWLCGIDGGNTDED